MANAFPSFTSWKFAEDRQRSAGSYTASLPEPIEGLLNRAFELKALIVTDEVGAA
ncbi:hypothetical protein [Rhizobium ruizarguesonis]|uniref:hypothetical protein n=1 Tax=Rhizobium ruizarguesonis TaxID=2081791 RepID=UPI0013EE80A0|nr:hypothetical protein [Rhizobium ruizarguesonis]